MSLYEALPYFIFIGVAAGGSQFAARTLMRRYYDRKRSQKESKKEE